MRATPLLFAAAALALDGCTLGLSRAPVERATYLLAASRNSPPPAAMKPVAIKVRPFRADPLYDRRELLYRLDGERVLSDFYNEFAERPDAMVTAAAVGWLKGAGLFAAVVEPGVPADAPYTLDGTVAALYGDLQNPQEPAAVMAIRFYVVRTGSASPEVVFDRTFRERVAIKANTPRALVQGYNEALGLILAALERDLAALELPK
jgi:ABC-type uncharacterized transport system auxiliary subunit